MKNDVPKCGDGVMRFILDIEWDSVLLVKTLLVDWLTLALKTFNSNELWLLLGLLDNCLDSIFKNQIKVLLSEFIVKDIN